MMSVRLHIYVSHQYCKMFAPDQHCKPFCIRKTFFLNCYYNKDDSDDKVAKWLNIVCVNFVMKGLLLMYNYRHWSIFIEDLATSL